MLGSLGALAQLDLKRLLAYSSVAHTGFLLIPFLFVGAKVQFTFLFYLTYYMMMLFSLLVVLNNFELKNLTYFSKNFNFLKLKCSTLLHNDGSSENSSYSFYLFSPYIAQKRAFQLTDFQNLYVFKPLLSFFLVIFLFTISGLPPFVGFFSKLFVLAEALNSLYVGVVMAALLSTILSILYYLRIIVFILQERGTFTLYTCHFTDSFLKSFLIAFLGLFFIFTLLDPLNFFYIIRLIA